MASRNIASILDTLTSEDHVHSKSGDKEGLEALITDYFTGNDEVTDNERSKAETTEVLIVHSN